MKKLFQSKIFHNFSWLFADKMIRLVLSLFVSIVVARYLGPENFGLWNYILSFTLFFTAFVGLGLESILPREIINNADRELAIISTAFVLKSLGALLAFSLNILLFIWYKSPDKDLLLMMSIMASFLIFQSSDLSDIVFKAKLNAKYSVIGRNSAFIIVALLKLYFVYNQFELVFFVASNAFEMLLGGLLVYFFFFKKGNHISLKSIDFKLGKKLLKDGVPLAISSLLIMLYMRVDQVMLTDIKGELANGIYSTGVKMIEIVYFLPIALSESFFPGIIYSKKHEGEKYNENLLGFYSIMTYTAISITVVTFIIAKPMMSLFYGQDYEGSGEVLQVLSLSLYAVFLSVASGKILVAENYLKIVMTRSILGLLINVVLNYLWIPQYGFMGAAYASLVSYFTPLMVLLLFRKTRPQATLILLAFNPKYLIDKLRSR